jgi:hypothetical protein
MNQITFNFNQNARRRDPVTSHLAGTDSTASGRRGALRKGEPRKCSTSGRLSVTWYSV